MSSRDVPSRLSRAWVRKKIEKRNSKIFLTSGWHSLNKEKKKKSCINLKFYGWPTNLADFMYRSRILEE
jgi:hypothetical protein